MQTMQDINTDIIATKIAELSPQTPTPDLLETMMELIDALVQDDLNEVVEGWVQREVDSGKTVEEAKVSLIEFYYNRVINAETPMEEFFAQQCFQAIMLNLSGIDQLNIQ